MGDAATVRRGGFRRFLWIALAIFVIGIVGWTWFTLSWAYSEGHRSGELFKFSKKGWLCKTYEGELALYVVGGVAPQLWHFSVRDEEVAKKLLDAVGKNIQLSYTEHRGVPTSCFAETPYFGRGFTILEKSPN